MTTTTAPVDQPEPGNRILDRLAGLAIGCAAAALVGLVLVQGWQVFARYVLNASPSWTEPVTLLLLATAMALGAAAGVRDQRHFGFFLLAQSARPPLRRWLARLSALVQLVIGLAVAGCSALLLVDGWGIRLAGAPLPQSINFLPLALGGTLIALFALDVLYRSLRGKVAGGER